MPVPCTTAWPPLPKPACPTHECVDQRAARGQHRSAQRPWQLDDPLTAPRWQQLRAATADRARGAVVAATLQRCALFVIEPASAPALPLQPNPRLRGYPRGSGSRLWPHRGLGRADRCDRTTAGLDRPATQRPPRCAGAAASVRMRHGLRRRTVAAGAVATAPARRRRACGVATHRCVCRCRRRTGPSARAMVTTQRLSLARRAAALSLP